MQASKTATTGLNAMAAMEILGVVDQIFHRLALDVELLLQRQDILERGTTMLADVAEGKIADVHAVHDERARDAEDGGCLGRAQLLIFREDCHALATEQPRQQG